MAIAPFRLMLFQLRLSVLIEAFSAMACPKILPDSSPKLLWLKSRYSIRTVLLIVFCFLLLIFFCKNYEYDDIKHRTNRNDVGPDWRGAVVKVVALESQVRERIVLL